MLRILGFFVELFAAFIEKLTHYKYRADGYLRSRYYMARLMNCGNELTVNGKPLLFGLNHISIGNHVTINNGVQISPQAGKVTLDDYVVMSRGSQIIAGQLDTSKWVGGGIKMLLMLA